MKHAVQMNKRKRIPWVTEPAVLETVFMMGELKEGDEVKVRPAFPMHGHVDMHAGTLRVLRVDVPEIDKDPRLVVALEPIKGPYKGEDRWFGYHDIIAWRRRPK